MKISMSARLNVAHRILTVLVISGLVLAVWPLQAAWATPVGDAAQAEVLAATLPLSLSSLARAGSEGEIAVGPGRGAAIVAQAGIYLYTIALPPGTAVVMGEHRAVLPFVVGNVLSSTASIDSVQLGLDASIYWLNEATSAPPGWQVTQIKNAGGGQAWIQFDVLPSGTPIPPGGQLTFELIVSGSRFGVFPTTNGDATDTLQLQYVTVKGSGHTFTLSGAAPTWRRRGLSATLSASPSSLGVGSPVTLIMEVTNYSAITQTGVIPSLPVVTGSGNATLTSGPTPATLALAAGQTRSFTWVYMAAGAGEVVFSASASNTVVSTALEQTDPVYIGALTAVLELEDTQVISGQLATVNMRVQNNGDDAVLDVEPSALSVLGTATAALASGPEPPIVPYLDAGATASFRWTHTIAGDVGATYAFSGTATADGPIASNVATSAQGEVARYLATVTPRFAVIGTVNQTLVFEVTNGGGESVNAIEFTIPSGFSYSAGNASGGYGGNWTIVQDGVGNPQYIGFSAPAPQELPVGGTATFTITFAALPAAPAEYSFAVRVEDTTGLAEYVEAFLTVTAYDVMVEAAPTSGLYADGRSTSIITATVTSGGVPQAGEEVRFDTTVGVLSTATASTDASGVATTTLVAPHSNVATSAAVTARSNGAQDTVVISYLGSYELTVYTVGSGHVTRDPHLVGYVPGEVVTLTAAADPGWSFDIWSGDLTGTTNPVTITMDGPKVVTATFTQDEYTLDANTVGDGSVTVDPPAGPYLYGNVITVTAVPSSGWAFSEWSGDLVSSENPETIEIVGDTVITATFLREAYPLTTTVVGGGTIARVPNQAIYLSGAVVTVTANAQPGWSFAGWSGDLEGTTNPTTITMDGPKTITATFTQDQYTLVLNIEGNGSVTAEPDQPTYLYGAAITVTAVPSAGWSFAGWSGDLSGMALVEVINIQGDTVITATFTQDEYILTVGTAGSGSVTVVPEQDTYFYGDVVTLTATADLGWSFSHWYGGLSGTQNPVTITIQGNITIGALFTQDEYALVVGTVGAGMVTRDPNQATYHYGDVVTVTAVPTLGWTFAGWSGDLSGANTVETVTIDSDTFITATFTQDEYTLTVNVDRADSGTVDPDPDQATYHYGDVVTLTAVANTGWTFWYWSGALSDTANPESLAIYGDTVVTATFQSENPVGPFTTLSIAPKAGSIVAGQSITYTAIVKGKYGSWDVSADATFSIDLDAGGTWTDNVYQPGDVGIWTVTVEYGGLTDTATLTIGQVKLYLPWIMRSYSP